MSGGGEVDGVIAILETAVSDIMPTFVNPTPWDNFNEMTGHFPSMFVQIKLDILQFAAIKKAGISNETFGQCPAEKKRENQNMIFFSTETTCQNFTSH